MTTDEMLQQMLLAHQQRMQTICESAASKSQELGRRLLDNVRDPLTIKAELAGLMQGAGNAGDTKTVVA